MTAKRRRGKAQSIREALGNRQLLLPGELPQEYEHGVAHTIAELQATTPLQRYLAQAIFECMWWIRRYERDKVASLTVAMARCITPASPYGELSEVQAHIAQAIANNRWGDRVLKDHLDAYAHTPQTLVQAATDKAMSRLVEVDRQIAQRVKAMASLQIAYEALVNRRLHAQRLQLQADLLRRDLAAIDVPAIEAQGSEHENQAAKAAV